MFYNETELAIGTGFFYEVGSEFFLLTARHNVTGRHAITNKPLHSSSAVPNRIHAVLWSGEPHVNWKSGEVALYDDDGIPDWYEHPVHGSSVDAVAIPVTSLDQRVRIYPANKLALDDIPFSPGMDVFVLGYPRAMTGGGYLPVWKRGSLAAEPDVEIDALPKTLIDTATREGISGALVIAQRMQSALKEGPLADNTIFGECRRILGLYSGRVGDDEYQAQLGIVWKERALMETILAKKRPTSIS